jgi:hypothetical protein
MHSAAVSKSSKKAKRVSSEKKLESFEMENQTAAVIGPSIFWVGWQGDLATSST